MSDEHDGHDHDHGAAGHSHAPKSFGLAFAVGLTLNFGFVVLEVRGSRSSHLADEHHGTALTARLVRDVDRCDSSMLEKCCKELHDKFEIQHATIQFETEDHDCGLGPDGKV